MDDDLDLDDGNRSSILTKAKKASKAPAIAKSTSGWGSDPDIDLGDADISDSLPKKSNPKASSWGDDDLNLDMDIDIGSSPSKLKKPLVSKPKAAPESLPADTADAAPIPVAKKKVTKPKVAVTKLSVEKSEDAAWDDF